VEQSDKVAAGSTPAVAARLLDSRILANLTASEILDTVPDAVSITDGTGRLVYLNEAWIALMGRGDRETRLETQAVFSRGVRGFRQDGSAADDREFAITRALTGEIVQGSELLLEFPDGRKVWLRTNARPIIDESGEIIGAIASSHDITKLRLLEAELARDRLLLQDRVQQLEMIISSMADGVIITDEHGNTLLTNAVYDQIIGIELGRLPALDHFPRLDARDWNGDHIEPTRGLVARTLAGERFSNEEILVTGASGSEVYLLVSGGPLVHAYDRVVGGVF